MWKRFLAGILALGVLLSGGVQAMAAEAVYDSAAKTLTVRGSLPSGRYEMVNLSVLPYTMAASEFSMSQSAQDWYLTKTFATQADGSFSKVIGLDSAFPYGRYTVYLTSDSTQETKLLLVYDSAALAAFLADLNKASASQARELLADRGKALGIVEADAAGYLARLSQTLCDERPSGGYTPDGFLNEYFLLEGIYRYLDGAVSFRQFMTEYASYITQGTALYDQASQAEKDSLETVMREFDLTGANFAASLEEGLFCAQAMQSATPADMQNKVIAYFEGHGIDTAAYRALNQYKRISVFEALYAQRGSLTSLAKLVSAFQTQTSIAAKDNGGDGGGHGGGSYGGGGGGYGGYGGGGGGYSSGGMGNSDMEVVKPETGQPVFADIANHWAKDQIERMARDGYVNGYGDGTFLPDAPVTRAEFVKLLCNVIGEASTDFTPVFEDVNPTDWFANCVLYAAAQGYVYGDGARFYPDESITRQDTAVVVERILRARGQLPAPQEAVDFADQEQTAEYAREAVTALAGIGLITGYQGSFLPLDSITRAEAAVMLCRALEYLG